MTLAPWNRSRPQSRRIVLMSARPSMWTTTRHSSAVRVRLPSSSHVVAVGEVRDALERAELLEDELPLVDAAAALHDDRLDAHLDEDVLLGRTVAGAELELAVRPAEEVEGGVLDLLAHRLLERRAVEAPLLEEDVARGAPRRRTSSARRAPA